MAPAPLAARLEESEFRQFHEVAGMKWSEAVTTATDWVSSIALHRLSLFHATSMRGIADQAASSFESWRQQMAATDYQALQRLESSYGADFPERAYARDAVELDRLRSEQYRTGSAADAAEARGRFAGTARNISRGLVGVGIAVDLADGESVPQAVASNVGGYAAGAVATTAVTAGASWLATTAAGAAIGTAIPIPVVGTVAGAVVGLGVGIFTSGAIDSLFKNGPDVGAAFEAGGEAITETVGAVGDGLEAAGDFVGGLFG